MKRIPAIIMLIAAVFIIASMPLAGADHDYPAATYDVILGAVLLEIGRRLLR